MNKPFEFDRAGFPMLWFDCVAAHVHWLPVTKVQFEYFLWDAPTSGLDPTWLERRYVSNMNPRVSPAAVNVTNYWGAFLTGIGPTEAQRYALWAEDSTASLSLPTADEWRKIHDEAAKIPSPGPQEDPLTAILQHRQLAPRAKTLLEKLLLPAAKCITGSTLAQRMLLSGGVMEWVQAANPRPGSAAWGIMGKPNPNFVSMGQALTAPQIPEPIPGLTSGDVGRHRAHGFRLLRKAS